MTNKLTGKKYHFIYKTINLLNEKYYIGMHSTNNLKDGYLGSGTWLKRSIRKYGRENFKCEILEFLNSREDLINREKEVITLNEVAKEKCMNLKPGGSGGFRDEEHKQKFIKIGADSHRRYLRENREYKENFSEICSKRQKKLVKNGAGHLIGKEKNWTGKKHSKESKLKQSLAKKGKYKGSENSQFGTCWITNEIENKKIYRGDLIPEGWRLGRKIKRFGVK